ncbi:MAG: FAD:protein FMN transferase, partial [Anaerohalosphaera sp.]|nr:FAD:protein FMN transferase [Anaerohalosphaera sp.]
MTDNKKTITNAMLSFAAIMTAFGAVILVQSFFDKEDTLVNSGFRDVMGTFAQVSVVMGDGRNGSEAGEAAFDQLTEVDASMSDYIEDSELSQLNRNGYDGPVKVSDGLFEVISAAVQYSRQSDGAFDITIGPLVGLWREAERTGAKPTEVQVAA